jgi:hypothetical protein
MDPEEWQKFLTTKKGDGQVIVGERPAAYWGSLADNYQANCLL